MISYVMEIVNCVTSTQKQTFISEKQALHIPMLHTTFPTTQSTNKINKNVEKRFNFNITVKLLDNLHTTK